jgi:phage-related tail fiber protein
MPVTKLDITRQATFSGNTNVGFKLTGVADPTLAQDAATKAYVDSVATGLDWKGSVRAATTAQGALATAYQNAAIIDGVTLATGDRILLKDQTAGTENGIYTVNATGAPTRSTDADTNAEVTPGLATFVEEGTANADKGYVLTNNGAITLGTTALTFAQFSGGGGGAGTVTSVSVVSANGLAGTVATNTTTPAITLTTTVTGLLKGNGTAISAAVAGTDYLTTANFVTRETPGGLVNSANTAFTLAATPLVGTEEVFLNGLQQDPGAGQDYTITGAAITYLTAPLTGDKIRVNYRK